MEEPPHWNDWLAPMWVGGAGLPIEFCGQCETLVVAAPDGSAIIPFRQVTVPRRKPGSMRGRRTHLDPGFRRGSPASLSQGHKRRLDPGESSTAVYATLDCRVAMLLAMTLWAIPPAPPASAPA